jgi:hypothetical protein
LQKENDYFRDEYQMTMERYTKLVDEMRERDSEWKGKLDDLTVEHGLKNAETLDAIHNLNNENEFLKTFYKVIVLLEIYRLEVKLKKIIAQLLKVSFRLRIFILLTVSFTISRSKSTH